MVELGEMDPEAVVTRVFLSIASSLLEQMHDSAAREQWHGVPRRICRRGPMSISHPAFQPWRKLCAAGARK